MGACKIQAKDLVRTRRYVVQCYTTFRETVLVVEWRNERLQDGYRIERLIEWMGLFRYIEKFYSMRTQLQAISLRIQTVRSNEQMMQ